MPTVLSLRSEHIRETSVKVAAVIRDGGVVAIPTESSYGLAVSPFHPGAVGRLFRIKARDAQKPILVLIGDGAQLPALIHTVPPAAERLMAAFWPGPLTIVMEARASLPETLTAGTGSLGVRLPAMPKLCELLNAVGPLTGTSANRSGEPPLETVERVLSSLGSDIDLILDGGRTAGGRPSTVLDARSPVHLLREGAVSSRDIAAVIAELGIQLSS